MMNRKIVFLVLFLIVVSLAGYFVFYQDTPVYTKERTVRYSLTVQNATNKLKKTAKLWVYGPAKQTSFQLTQSLKSSTPYILSTDSLGNQILEFEIKNLPPFGTKLINIEASLLLSETPQNIKPMKGLKHYLMDEQYLDMQDPLIQKAASDLLQNNPENIALHSLNWVNNHINYSGFVKNDHGALYALKNKSGDCTEYMYLLTALNRTNGIHTRGVGGYIVKENSVLKSKDFHNWAEVYVDNKWRVADAQNNRYMKNEKEYLVFRILGNSENKRLKNTHRFAYSDENLIVKMN